MPHTVIVQDVITIERSEVLPDNCPGCGASTIDARVWVNQYEGSTQSAVNVEGAELDDWSISDYWHEGDIALAYKCGECKADLVPAAEETNINEPKPDVEGSMLATVEQISRAQACVQRHIDRCDTATAQKQTSND